MFLKETKLDISFRVGMTVSPLWSMLLAGIMKCFECGNIGHMHIGCPHKAQESTSGVETFNV